jgi:hypothetical protein
LDLSTGSIDNWGSIVSCTNLKSYLTSIGAPSTVLTRAQFNAGQREPLWFLAGDVVIFQNDSGTAGHAMFAIAGDATHYATLAAHTINTDSTKIADVFNSTYPLDLAFTHCTFYDLSNVGRSVPNSTAFNVGDSVKVTASPTNLNMRKGPGVGYDSVTSFPYGTILTVQQNSQNGTAYNGYYWWYVSSSGGTYTDWCAEAYLQKVQVADTTPPTINSFSVTPSSVTLGGSFTISYTVSDTGGSGLNRVELWRANIDGTINDSSWKQIGSAISLTGDGPSNGNFPPDTPPAAGNYWYGIHVFDNANNYMDERIAGRGPIMVTVNPANSAPTLTGGSVSPPSGDTLTNFYYYVNYNDTDGDSPSTKQVFIDGVSYTMTLYSGSAANGTYRYGPKTLSASSHSYQFYFEDGRGGTAWWPSPTSCQVGPTVTPPPVGEFDRENIISDEEFRNLNSMTLSQVQSFLEIWDSQLKEENLYLYYNFSYPEYPYFYNYVLANGKLGRESSPAEIIYYSAWDPQAPPNHVNPQVLLVTLQKEQSLIEGHFSSAELQNRLDAALGYACPDVGGPDPKYRGYFNQVISAAYQMTQAFEARSPGVQPAMLIDGEWIYPANRATAVLYEYTPHFPGNYNFWLLYNKYFARSVHGDVNGDGKVDFRDLEIMASNWLEENCSYPEWCQGADLNYSGRVDLADFAIFAEHWLEGL